MAIGTGLAKMFSAVTGGAVAGQRQAEEQRRYQTQLEAQQKQQRDAAFNSTLKTAVLLTPESRDQFLTERLGEGHGVQIAQDKVREGNVSVQFGNMLMTGPAQATSNIFDMASKTKDFDRNQQKRNEIMRIGTQQGVSFKQLSPKEERSVAPTEIQRLHAYYASLPEGSQERTDVANLIKRKTAETKGGQTIKVNIHPSQMPLTRSATTTIQKDLFEGEKTLSKLQQVVSDFNPESLTYKGQAMSKWRREKEKIGFPLDEQEKAKVTAHTRFVQGINQFFNAYRKEITGAAAPIRELEQLKKDVISTAQSPTEFRASANALMEKAKKVQRLQRKVLREGLYLGTPEHGRRLNDLWVKGDDDSFSDRVMELRAEGKTTEEAYTIMADEGY